MSAAQANQAHRIEGVQRNNSGNPSGDQGNEGKTCDKGQIHPTGASERKSKNSEAYTASKFTSNFPARQALAKAS